MENQTTNPNAPAAPALQSPFIPANNPDGSPRLRKAFITAGPTHLQKGLLPTGSTDSVPCPTSGIVPAGNALNPQPMSEASINRSNMYPPMIQLAQDNLLYFPETPIRITVFDSTGTPKIVNTGFQKGIPAKEVTQEQLIDAIHNTLKLQENQNMPPNRTENQSAAMPFAPINSGEERFLTTAEGIFFINKENLHKEKLCNFQLIPQKFIAYFKGDNLDTTFVESEIILHGQSHKFVVEISKIDDLTKIIKKAHPAAIVYSDVVKAEAHISEYFRQFLRDLPTETVQMQVGWTTWQNHKIFAHDARPSCNREPLMCTGKAVLSDSRFLNYADTLYAVMKLGPLNITAPMIASCLLGFLHVPFAEANNTYAPRYALFINGPTGSLKTASAKVIFNIYDSDSPYLAASFKDTAASIEIRLKELPCSPILIDDFYATGLSGERSDMQKTLETVIRYVGDGIGKNRSNANLQDVKGTRPSGTVIITGEDTAGQMSTLLRCLILCVNRKTFDKEILSDFQNNPLRWSTFIAAFLQYLEKNYLRIVTYVRTTYPAIRNQYQKSFKDLRPVDQLVQMILVFHILMDFFNAATPGNQEIQKLLAACIDACYSAVQESQEYASENSYERQYAFILAKLIAQNTILVSDTRAAYANQPGTYDGFTEKDFLYLNNDAVYAKVRQHFRQQGREFPLSQLEATRALNQASLLTLEKEKKKNGETKIHMEVKVSISDKRPRMLKMNLSAFQAYTGSEN